MLELGQDAFACVVDHLDLTDALNMGKVCVRTRSWLHHPTVFRLLWARYGPPRVEDPVEPSKRIKALKDHAFMRYDSSQLIGRKHVIFLVDDSKSMLLPHQPLIADSPEITRWDFARILLGRFGSIIGELPNNRPKVEIRFFNRANRHVSLEGTHSQAWDQGIANVFTDEPSGGTSMLPRVQECLGEIQDGALLYLFVGGDIYSRSKELSAISTALEQKRQTTRFCCTFLNCTDAFWKNIKWMNELANSTTFVRIFSNYDNEKAQVAKSHPLTRYTIDLHIKRLLLGCLFDQSYV